MADTKGAAELGATKPKVTGPREPIPPPPALPAAFQARQAARAARDAAVVADAVPSEPEAVADQPPPGIPATAIKVPQLPVHVKPQPQWLTPDLAKRAAEIKALTDENFTRFMALRNELGVTIPAAKILELKLEAILDTFFPMETRKGQFHRLEFEANFERLMRQQIDQSRQDAMVAIDDMKGQIRKQLLAGQIPAGMTVDQLIQVTQELGMPVPEGLLKQAAANG